MRTHIHTHFRVLLLLYCLSFKVIFGLWLFCGLISGKVSESIWQAKIKTALPHPILFFIVQPNWNLH